MILNTTKDDLKGIFIGTNGENTDFTEIHNLSS